MVVVTKTAAEVRHGHADTGGSHDAPKGMVIKRFPFDKYGRKGAIKRAQAMHYAIVKSEQRAHSDAVSASSVATPIALRTPTQQYSEADDLLDRYDLLPDDDFRSDFFSQGAFANSDKGDEDVDIEQLRLGIIIEHEHTDDDVVATKIALDHLMEIPDYYTRLIAMEREAKGIGKRVGDTL